MNSSQLVFEYLPNIEELPLILVGPILRRTEADSVTVWLALKESRSLCLEIYETEDNGASLGMLVFAGKKDTIKLGQHLHIVAVTATGIEQNLLEVGKIYAYNVYFDGDEVNPSHRFSLLDELQSSVYSLSYFDHQLPTFALPPDDLNQLKVIHGSCRKPHGGGQDTLSCIDNLIGESAHSATERPHQLFMTGDQIYGDDVADPILWLSQGISKLLFGWTEKLPLKSGNIDADELLPGERAEIAEIEGGLTSMLEDTPEEAKSHLMSFGEYAAAYLLAWSPVFIPPNFPEGKTIFQDSKQARNWDKELKEIASFIRDLNYVRRGLANIPVYTICDDHDVSDDWYLNREWCDRVLGKPLGKRIVQNGLLAYALFQGWGNTPKYFASGTAGDKLLKLGADWCASKGQDESIKQQCDRYLGIPENDVATGLPKFTADGDVSILDHHSLAIPWHYKISNYVHEVIVLDTRTWRGYPPRKEQKLDPPRLLSPHAFQEQLENPLSTSKPNIEATIVVLPTNMVTLGVIDLVQKFELSRDRVFHSDVGDSWNFNESAFAQLLLTLCRQRRQVIILSGDIHYSCAVKLSHTFADSPAEETILVQLTSSAIKNSEVATRVVHTKLKSLFPEKTKHWLGWNNPLEVKQVRPGNKKPKYLNATQSSADWQYQVQWCKRNQAQTLPWKKMSPQLTPRGYAVSLPDSSSLWQRLIDALAYLLWRNPWLQEGSEVIGRNNLSLVRFEWSTNKKVIQETYWYPPWDSKVMVKSSYFIALSHEP